MSTGDTIPSTAQCDELISRYGMLPNIVDHSRQVTRVCLALADRLTDRDSLNRELLSAAALLHDITKTRSLETGEKHDQTGAALLEELGYPLVAEIVRRHVFFGEFFPDGPLTEAEIVYYADKRVMHDRIVTVDERVKDLMERYGRTPEVKDLILKNSEFVYRIERKIARHLSVEIDTALASIPHG